MPYPTVHLNGTDRAELLSQALNVHDALLAAQDALSKACPNARDYYVQGDDAFVLARTEHLARVQALGDLHDYYHGLALYLDGLEG